MKGVIVPPLKYQGIKTKLVPFLKEYVKPDPDGTWVEPFLGSGAVALNIGHPRARLSDKNEYIINLYKGIQNGSVSKSSVKEFLEYHGSKLKEIGEDYFYEMRNEFNQNHSPFHFIFLNRTCFNGATRFNKKGEFCNTFCKNPNKFHEKYISKVCDQIDMAYKIISEREWTFECCHWTKAFESVTEVDYIYLDPPYIGRNVVYSGQNWTAEDTIQLALLAHKTPANVALSEWKEDSEKRNELLYEHWSDFRWHEHEHRYILSGNADRRARVTEVLAIKR